MKKNVYKFEDIDCAACATKIEDKVGRLDGVHASTLNLMFLKLIVEFDESKVTDKTIEDAIHQAKPGVVIVAKNNEPYNDTYESEAPKTFKKIPFFGRKPRQEQK